MMAAVGTAHPLRGKLIVVTRARQQARALSALLEEAGATVLAAATIVIEPPDSWASLDQALRRASEYDWAVFTSVNGVEMVKRRLEVLGLAPRALAGCRLAAIGPATAHALGALGLRPDVVPEEYVAEELAAGLEPLIRRGDRVLLARAAETRDLLVRELERMGARVEEVAAYRTRPVSEGAEELKAALRAGRVDVVTFTSSSTVRHFTALFSPGELGRLMAGVTVACIGPVTLATAREVGLDPTVMAEEYTIAGLARAIRRYYESPASRGPDPT
jgi:uroporphyrinogen III methyltransferase / synthase